MVTWTLWKKLRMKLNSVQCFSGITPTWSRRTSRYSGLLQLYSLLCFGENWGGNWSTRHEFERLEHLGMWFIWRLFGCGSGRFLFMYLFLAEVELWFTFQNLHGWFNISLTGLCIYNTNIFSVWEVGREPRQLSSLHLACTWGEEI